MQRGRQAIDARIDEVEAMVGAMVRRDIRPGRHEAEDLIQEGIYGVLLNAHHYDPARGTLSTFVYRVARTYLFQRVFIADGCDKRRVNFETVSLNKKVRVYKTTGCGAEPEIELGDLISSGMDAEDEALRHVEAERIWKIAGEVLNDKERMALSMRMSDDQRTYREIGSELGLTHARAEQLEQKAIAKLQRALRTKKRP